MGIYSFVGPGVDVSDGDNWRDNIHGTTGSEPGTGDDTTIFAAGTLTGLLDVNSVAIQSQGTGTLQFGGGGVETDVDGEGAPTTITGLVTFDDASLEPDGLVVEANSTLRFDNGAFDDSFFGSNDITIGSQMGTSAVIVDNSSFRAGLGGDTLAIGSGQGDVGRLTVENGSDYHISATVTMIGADDGSSGQVIISGKTTSADFDGQVDIGGSGTGTFTLSGGAYASLGLDSNVVVGGQGANGSVTATGAGSLLSVSGDLQLGSYTDSGLGTATVAQGATLAAGGDVLEPEGLLSVSGTGSFLSARDFENLGTSAQLHVTTGGVASFVDATIQAGGAILQGGTLDARRLVENLTTIKGNGVINATTLYNFGTLSAIGGTLQLSAPEVGTGSNLISKASTLELDGSVARSQKIFFQAGAKALDLKDAAGMQGVIHGFTSGELIDLVGDAATKTSFASDILTISNGSTAVATLHFAGSYTGADFKLASDGHGGSLVTYSTADVRLDRTRETAGSFMHHTA